MIICPCCHEQAIVHSVRGKCRIDCACDIFDQEFTREEINERLRLDGRLGLLANQPDGNVVMGC